MPPNDIATFCRWSLSAGEKHELMNRVWVPDSTYKFPTSGARNFKFHRSWFHSFKWLVCSATEDDAYCRFCVPFGSKTIGKDGHETPNYFVKAQFQTWKKAIEKFKEHESKKYRQDAMEDTQNFKLIYENVKSDVVSEIDNSRKKQLRIGSDGFQL